MTKQLIVAPTDVWVVDNTPDAELTLTACHPKGSASQRIVIKAKLVPSKSTKPAKPEAGHALDVGREVAHDDDGDGGQPGPGSVGADAQPRAERALGDLRRGRRPRVVVGLPPLAAPAHVGGRRAAVPRRAVPVLRLPGTRASRRLLIPAVTVSRASVDEAARRIAAYVHRTPVLRSRSLDEWVGAEVFVKAEHLQRSGAFKYRGATNAVQSLTDHDARRGVAAHSSGNHAAALALAARVRGIPAFVVMPSNTSAAKRAAVERYGAAITWCDNSLDARRAALATVLEHTGAVEIHPFDDERVIAGAGTAGLELAEEVPDLDVVVTPIGGGGLCSGTSVAVAPTRVIGGMPRDRAATIADGLRTGCSPRTEAILDAHHVDRIVADETDVVAAMRVVWERTKQLIEPSAAVAFAAARAAAPRRRTRRDRLLRWQRRPRRAAVLTPSAPAQAMTSSRTAIGRPVLGSRAAVRPCGPRPFRHRARARARAPRAGTRHRRSRRTPSTARPDWTDRCPRGSREPSPSRASGCSTRARDARACAAGGAWPTTSAGSRAAGRWRRSPTPPRAVATSPRTGRRAVSA